MKVISSVFLNVFFVNFSSPLFHSNSCTDETRAAFRELHGRQNNVRSSVLHGPHQVPLQKIWCDCYRFSLCRSNSECNLHRRNRRKHLYFFHEPTLFPFLEMFEFSNSVLPFLMCTGTRRTWSRSAIPSNIAFRGCASPLWTT